LSDCGVGMRVLAVVSRYPPEQDQLITQQLHLAPPLRSPMASSSPANFRYIFNASLQAYDNKTKNKLLGHPLATQLQSCDSPNSVLTVLQDLVQQSDQRRTSDERLKNWLDPTVNVLYAFSNTLGEGVGLVSFSSLSPYNLCSDCHLSGIPTW
jgi:hypothetical protein